MPRKPSLAIVTLVCLLAILSYAKVLTIPDVLPHATLSPPLQNATTQNPITQKLQLPTNPYLLDPTHRLAPFYAALERAGAHQGTANILHYGDSPTTADSITADLRSLFQDRFGDAGHGFVLIAKPWAWYGHRGVTLAGSGWKIQPATQSRARDGIHGLGGVSFEGTARANARFHFETAHNKLEVHYFQQPNGGTVAVSAQGKIIAELHTDGEKQLAYATFSLPPETTDIALEVESGTARLFGIGATKTAPGVIYNSLGLNGGQVQVVVRYFETEQWTAALQHQHPDLLVINYGTNESVFEKYIDTLYAGELRQVIERVRAALPDTPILVMSPMDRGERKPDGTIGTAPAIPKIVAIQKQVALETGCAFFNTYEAMGGSGTMGLWYAAQPRLISADFMHPLPAGAKKVSLLLYDALTSSLTPQSPLPPQSQTPGPRAPAPQSPPPSKPQTPAVPQIPR